jgi:hypothetical protein
MKGEHGMGGGGDGKNVESEKKKKQRRRGMKRVDERDVKYQIYMSKM